MITDAKRYLLTVLSTARRPRILVLRLLVVNYVLTFALLILGNIPAVGSGLIRLQDASMLIRILLGLMGVLWAVTFFFLFGYCLYHCWTHTKDGFNTTGWFLVLLLMNFVGIVIYYLVVIEGEYRKAREAREVTGG